MGLDIYFYRRRFKTEEEREKGLRDRNPNQVASEAWEQMKEDDFCYDQDEIPICKLEEVLYYRKVNFLMDYFHYFDKCMDEGDSEGDATYVIVPREEFESFIVDADDLLKQREEMLKKIEARNKAIADGTFNKETDDFDEEYETSIKPMDGFFFGSTQLDEYFFENVEICLSEFQNLLDETGENDVIYMYTSW